MVKWLRQQLFLYSFIRDALCILGGHFPSGWNWALLNSIHGATVKKECDPLCYCFSGRCR